MCWSKDDPEICIFFGTPHTQCKSNFAVCNKCHRHHNPAKKCIIRSNPRQPTKAYSMRGEIAGYKSQYSGINFVSVRMPPEHPSVTARMAEYKKEGLFISQQEVAEMFSPFYLAHDNSSIKAPARYLASTVVSTDASPPLQPDASAASPPLQPDASVKRALGTTSALRAIRRKDRATTAARTAAVKERDARKAAKWGRESPQIVHWDMESAHRFSKWISRSLAEGPATLFYLSGATLITMDVMDKAPELHALHLLATHARRSARQRHRQMPSLRCYRHRQARSAESARRVRRRRARHRSLLVESLSACAPAPLPSSAEGPTPNSAAIEEPCQPRHVNLSLILTRPRVRKHYGRSRKRRRSPRVEPWYAASPLLFLVLLIIWCPLKPLRIGCRTQELPTTRLPSTTTSPTTASRQDDEGDIKSDFESIAGRKTSATSTPPAHFVSFTQMIEMTSCSPLAAIAQATETPRAWECSGLRRRKPGPVPEARISDSSAVETSDQALELRPSGTSAPASAPAKTFPVPLAQQRTTRAMRRHSRRAIPDHPSITRERNELVKQGTQVIYEDIAEIFSPIYFSHNNLSDKAPARNLAPKIVYDSLNKAPVCHLASTVVSTVASPPLQPDASAASPPLQPDASVKRALGTTSALRAIRRKDRATTAARTAAVKERDARKAAKWGRESPQIVHWDMESAHRFSKWISRSLAEGPATLFYLSGATLITMDVMDKAPELHALHLLATHARRSARQRHRQMPSLRCYRHRQARSAESARRVRRRRARHRSLLVESLSACAPAPLPSSAEGPTPNSAAIEEPCQPRHVNLSLILTRPRVRKHYGRSRKRRRSPRVEPWYAASPLLFLVLLIIWCPLKPLRIGCRTQELPTTRLPSTTTSPTTASRQDDEGDIKSDFESIAGRKTSATSTPPAHFVSFTHMVEMTSCSLLAVIAPATETPQAWEIQWIAQAKARIKSRVRPQVLPTSTAVSELPTSTATSELPSSTATSELPSSTVASLLPTPSAVSVLPTHSPAIAFNRIESEGRDFEIRDFIQCNHFDKSWMQDFFW